MERETETRHTDREGEWADREVGRVGEREIDKQCIISPLGALEATWLFLNDISGNVK